MTENVEKDIGTKLPTDLPDETAEFVGRKQEVLDALHRNWCYESDVIHIRVCSNLSG